MDRRFWAGLFLTAVVSLAVPVSWYAVHEVYWSPGHDDMVSLLISSEGHNRADAVLSPPSTSRRSAREVLETIAPRTDFGVVDTVVDAYRLSINPPVYVALLNLWRRAVGGSSRASMALSLLLGSLSACVLYAVLARERGWRTALLVSLLYVFSPTYWDSALATRQYALAALVSPFLAWSLVSLLRTGPERTLGAASGLVAAGTLLTLTAYQSSVLVASLLAGLLVVAVLRGERRLARTACWSGLAFGIACCPIVLLAAWQARHGGPLGVPIHTLRPFGGPAATAHAALQAFLSIFVDVPYAHVPLAALAIATFLVLAGLAYVAAGETPQKGPGTLLVVSILVGGALYAALVFLRQLPAWFQLRYFTAYSAMYLALLALARTRAPRSETIRRAVLGGILVLSSGTFLSRTGLYIATDRPVEESVFRDLLRARILLTDTRQHALVLQFAAHAAPEANLWLVRLPIDASSCEAIARDIRGVPAAMIRTGEADRAEFEKAVRACLPERGSEVIFYRGWLDLVIWEPPPAGTAPHGAGSAPGGPA